MPDSSENLYIYWQDDLTVLSLRGEGVAIAQGVKNALSLDLPLSANTTRTLGGIRLVWVSPDDCFVIAPPAQASRLEAALREALQGQHFAVTDVSSGYLLLTLAGSAARATLAQGCPLDLHPRSLGLGQCAGSHFFKASLWLWPASDESKFELLVRRSFAPYVDTMINKASLECKVQRAGVEIEAYV